MVGTGASSETVDISTLSDYEKKVHRITVPVMAEAMLFSKVPDHGDLSFDVYGLLGDDKFFVRIRKKTKNISLGRT